METGNVGEARLGGKKKNEKGTKDERKKERAGGRKEERKRKERRGKGEEERGKENEKGANTPAPSGETPAAWGGLKPHHPQPLQKHQFLVGRRPKCEGGSITPSNLWPTCHTHTQMEK